MKDNPYEVKNILYGDSLCKESPYYPTQLMFTTLEKARQNKPENDYSTGNSREYYIKEVEID